MGANKYYALAINLKFIQHIFKKFYQMKDIKKMITYKLSIS